MMSDQMPANLLRANAVNSTGDATRFLSQLMLLPFSASVYSLEIFIQALKAIQRITEQGINATTGATASLGTPPRGGNCFVDTTVPRAADAAAVTAGTSQQATREEEKEMSDQSWSSSSRSQDSGGREQAWSSSGGQTSSVRDEGWSISEECREKDPCDRLRLVRFKILFLKRNLEIAFPEEEELVSEDMPKDGFISWKIAEFIQSLSRREIKQPGKWKDENNYPADEEGGKLEDGYVVSLPDKDKRFLRVYCQVLAWYDREKRNYERDQADTQRDIKDELKKISSSLKKLANDS